MAPDNERILATGSHVTRSRRWGGNCVKYVFPRRTSVAVLIPARLARADVVGVEGSRTAAVARPAERAGS